MEGGGGNSTRTARRGKFFLRISCRKLCLLFRNKIYIGIKIFDGIMIGGKFKRRINFLLLLKAGQSGERDNLINF